MNITPVQSLLADAILARCDASKEYSVRVWYLRTTSADKEQAANYTVMSNNKDGAETVAKQKLCREFNIPWRMSHMIMVKFL